MENIQVWFNQRQKSDTKQIHIRPEEIKDKLEGKQLIIKNYKNLKNIYIDIEQLEHIKIENCELLEKITTNGVEIELIGEYKKLHNIKTINQVSAPVVIQKEKEPIICKKCLSIFLFFVVVITWFYRHIEKKFKNLKDYHDRECKGTQKTIKN